MQRSILAPYNLIGKTVSHHFDLYFRFCLTLNLIVFKDCTCHGLHAPYTSTAMIFCCLHHHLALINLRTSTIFKRYFFRMPPISHQQVIQGHRRCCCNSSIFTAATHRCRSAAAGHGVQCASYKFTDDTVASGPCDWVNVL